jgi:septum formation protein
MILNEQLKGYRIILASQSPRRQELLRDLGISFETVIRDYDETYPEGLSGEEIARYVSASKAQSFKNEIRENDIVITADTIVWCKNTVLGKPVSQEDAIRMITAISGDIHEVITAVTLLSSEKMITFSDITKVRFDSLSPDEIRYYVERFKPYDKAGAYGIQEWIGLAACSYIEGSYFNVVGLPVQRLYIELKKFL